MKKFYFFRRVLPLLTLLFLSISSAWGADGDVFYTLSTTKSTSNTAYATYYDVKVPASTGLTWNAPGNQNFSGYWRIGGKSLSNVDRTITGKSAIGRVIGKVTLNHNGVSNANLTINSISLTVASASSFANNTIIETITKTSPSVSSAGSIDFEPTGSDWPSGSYYKLIINCSNSTTSNYGFDFKSLVFYEGTTAVDNRTAVNMTSFSADQTTLIKNATTNTHVTNDQSGWTVAYTYESSNTSVATVSNTGVITAVAKGTARITATLNVANDDANYKAGSTTSKYVDITVNNPSHTAQFSINGTVNDANNKSVEEGSSITFPADPKIDDVVFMGWTKTIIDGTTDNAPSDLCTSATMGTEDATYYAVFATQDGEPAVETKTQTLQYDTWTYSGSTTNKTSYRLFHSGSYIESASFDRSKLTKVIVYGGTFGGDSYNKLTIGDGTNTWKSVTVSGSSQTGVNTYTGGTALSGTGSIRITSNSGSASSNGVRISKVEIFTLEGGYTYSDYCTSVVVKTLEGISVKTAPSKVTYTEDEMFDPAGLVITATYNDKSTEDIAYAGNESKFTFSPSLTTALTPSNQNVTITYNEKETTQTITVNAIPTYVLTITQPTAGGTLTVKKGEDILSSGANVRVGTNLTCEVTGIPEGKRFSRFYAKWGEGDGESKYKATNPATFDNIAAENIMACEIYVTYKDIQYYTINYIINGVNTDPQENLEEKSALTFPTAPATIAGKYFIGWTEDEIDGTTNDEPSYVATAGLTASSNKTYYAVFATETGVGNPNVLVPVTGPITTGDYYLVDTYEGLDKNNNAVDKYWAVNGSLDNTTRGGFSSMNMTEFVSETNGRLAQIDLTELAQENWPTKYTITVSNEGIGIANGGENYYCKGDNVNADMVNSSDETTYLWNAIEEGTGNNAGRYSIVVSHGTGSRCILFFEHSSSNNQFRSFKNQDQEKRGTLGGKSENSYGSGYFYFLQAGYATYSDYCTSIKYTRNVTNALGSICLPYAVASTENSNATFYEVAGKRVNASGEPTSIVLSPVTALTAGMPYIFEAEDTTEPVALVLSGDAESAGYANGVYGTFEELTISSIGYDSNNANAASYWYAVSNNTFKAMNTGSKVSANRAYLKMAEVLEYEEPTTPGAPVRIITLVDEANTATGIDTSAGSATDSQKFLKDGQLFILRNGVLYNAIGQVVK